MGEFDSLDMIIKGTGEVKNIWKGSHLLVMFYYKIIQIAILWLINID